MTFVQLIPRTRLNITPIRVRAEPPRPRCGARARQLAGQREPRNLTIYATAGDDFIHVANDSQQAGQLDATVNGFTETYNAATLYTLGVSSGNGNDLIETGLAVTILATVVGDDGAIPSPPAPVAT